MKYFPETRVKLKLSKEKEIEQLLKIKNISADYRKTKRKCESVKDELNHKRLKTEVKNKKTFNEVIFLLNAYFIFI